MTEPVVSDNGIDNHVDDAISKCLSLEEPKSFFLFAGAGSGKTRSLVTSVKKFVSENEKTLRLKGQRVGIITYTNAAVEEIKSRLNSSPLVQVSTIHSFVWQLISGFNTDIRNWLSLNLVSEIQELQQKQLTGRAGKASETRARDIVNKTRRLEGLPNISKFNYNPNNNNFGRDALNHSEVIKIGSDFLTNKHLMEALFAVQRDHSHKFVLGLLGDTMQRIYSDGKIDLGQNLPNDWEKPAKVMNHRCPKRVVSLINKIRASVDDKEQMPRSDSSEGIVRLFIGKSGEERKADLEQAASRIMFEITGDAGWLPENKHVKILILEHLMAARRLNFIEMFEPLYRNDKYKTGLLDGTFSATRFFSSFILPLVEAKRNENDFAVAAIVRSNSELISKKALIASPKDQIDKLKVAKSAVESLIALWDNDHDPTFREILENVGGSSLFPVPEILKPFVSSKVNQTEGENSNSLTKSEDDEEDEMDVNLETLNSFLNAKFSQIKAYSRYIEGRAEFDTHQGVKGREFPRVMVVIDDDEAGGFLFQYEKLFGVKEQSATDLKNENEGNDTAINRTRRLFYVTCSRAEQSLAVFAYTESPEALRNHVLSQGWFSNDEIIDLIPEVQQSFS
jgi:DNA helicase-2/ATP-dependent DNA helicase PcrA